MPIDPATNVAPLFRTTGLSGRVQIKALQGIEHPAARTNDHIDRLISADSPNPTAFVTDLNHVAYGFRAAGMDHVPSVNAARFIDRITNTPMLRVMHPIGLICHMLEHAAETERLAIVALDKGSDLVLNGQAQDGIFFGDLSLLVDTEEVRRIFPEQTLHNETSEGPQDSNVIYLSGHMMSDPKHAIEVLFHEATHYGDFRTLQLWLKANAKLSPQEQDDLYKMFTHESQGRRVIDPAFLYFFLEYSATLGTLTISQFLGTNARSAVADALAHVMSLLKNPFMAAIAEKLGITRQRLLADPMGTLSVGQSLHDKIMGSITRARLL